MSRLTRRRLLANACTAAAALPFARVLAGCSPEADQDDRGAGPQAAQGESPTRTPGAQPGVTQPPPAGGGAQATGPGTAQAPVGGDTRLVTEIPEMQGLVQSLQYVNESPRPDQQCGNCVFFVPASEERGRCQLFAQGHVLAPGWCISWQQRAAGAG